MQMINSSEELTFSGMTVVVRYPDGTTIRGHASPCSLRDAFILRTETGTKTLHFSEVKVIKEKGLVMANAPGTANKYHIYEVSVSTASGGLANHLIVARAVDREVSMVSVDVYRIVTNQEESVEAKLVDDRVSFSINNDNRVMEAIEEAFVKIYGVGTDVRVIERQIKYSDGHQPN